MIVLRGGKCSRAWVAGLLACSVPFGPALAGPLLIIPGVLEIGTVDPSTDETDSSGSTTSGEGYRTGSNDTRTCVVGTPDDCQLWRVEHEEYERDDHDTETWTSTSRRSRDATGVYATAPGLASGEVATGPSSSSSTDSGACERVHNDHTRRSDDGGWSREDISVDEYSCEHSTTSDRTVSDTGGDWTTAAGDLFLHHETDGHESSRNRETSQHTTRSYESLYGFPVSDRGGSTDHSAEGSSDRTWNELRGGGTLFLAAPPDGSRVEVVGLHVARGDAREETSSSSSDTSTSYVRDTQFASDGSSTDTETSRTTSVTEWLRLSFDLLDGTVSGSLDDEWADETSDASSESHRTTTVYGMDMTHDETSRDASSSTSRSRSFTLDAADGAASVDGSRLEGTRHEEAGSSVHDSIGGTGFGSSRERASDTTWDGTALTIDVGHGALTISASRAESTATSTTHDTVSNPDGATTETGTTSDERAETTEASVGALADVQAHSEDANSSRSTELYGVSGTSGSSRNSRSVTGSALESLYSFRLDYRQERSQESVAIGGLVAGNEQRDASVGHGGALRGTDGRSAVVYDFDHSEASDRTAVGPAGRRNDVTGTHLSVVVLDGAGRLAAGRDSGRTHTTDGDRTLTDDSAGTSSVEAEAGPASAGNALTVSYSQTGEAASAVVVNESWCAGAGAGEDVVALLPPEAQAAARAALDTAASIGCGAQDASVGLLPLSPCIAVPIALGTTFEVARTVAGQLPVGRDEVLVLLDTASAAVHQAYEDHVGCRWLSIPGEAREPQPLLMADDAAP